MSEVQFAIAEDLTVDAILGLEFLAGHQGMLNFRTGVLDLPHVEIPLVPISSTRSRAVPVSVVEDIRIPPSCELDIMGHFSPIPIGDYLLEQTTGKSLPVRVARALVSATEKGVPLRLINPSTEMVVLHKGTQLATMEPFENQVIHQIGPKGKQTGREVSQKKINILSSLASGQGGLSQAQRNQLLSLLTSYADIFAEGANDLGRTNVTTHTIDTGMAAPIKEYSQRIPMAYREEASGLIEDMLEKGTIQPSQSPRAAPIVLVKKKNGALRFCVDYRKLNATTRKDAYPIPRIDDTLDTLAGSQWFSTLDLISGYGQVELDSKDKEKTAFSSPDGLFEFNVMPFGLCNAPATFQRLMDMVLAGMNWKTCLVYLDDIIILGRDFPTHLQNMDQIFSCLRQAGLKLQPSKCRLCQQAVSFLGHIVSPTGIATDPEKNRANRQLANPTLQKGCPAIPRTHQLLSSLHPKLCSCRKAAQSPNRKDSHVPMDGRMPAGI